VADQLRWRTAPAWGHHGDQRADNPGDGPAPRPERPGVPVLERNAVRVQRGGLTGVLSGTWPSSSTLTELPDAIQRAEFNQTAKADWHTELAPGPTPSLAIQIPFGDYFFQLNGDGTCCEFILVNSATFDNAFFSTIVEAISNGTITTQDISTFLFPNTYLFIGTLSVCCVLGLHSYVFNDLPSGVEQRWVLNYSSWISPCLFRAGCRT
jgi:hypothetical protein